MGLVHYGICAPGKLALYPYGITQVKKKKALKNVAGVPVSFAG